MLLVSRVIVTLAPVVLAASVMLRRRYLQRGSTQDEQHDTLAGDELLPRVDVSAARGISIDAAADAVWPWIAQLGQVRGGFYS